MRIFRLAAVLAAAAAAPVLAGAAERGILFNPLEQVNLVSPAQDDGPLSPKSDDHGRPTTAAIRPGDATPVPFDTELWIGKPIVSADGVVVGTVDDVQLDGKGRPVSITTIVGGFFGIGGARLRLPAMPASFSEGEVRLAIVETDVSALASADRRPDRR